MAIGANFTDGDFVDASLLNQQTTYSMQSDYMYGALLHTPGLVQPYTIATQISGLNLTLNFPTYAGVLFGDGVLATGHGTTNGTDSGTYTLNLASLVPSSGSATVYIIAEAAQVYQGAHAVAGPPAGNPDFDPNFSPIVGYSEVQDTLAISATIFGPPNNVTQVEVCRLTLSAGQTAISSIDTTHQVLAGSILSQNGEVQAADLAPGAAAYNVGALGGDLIGNLPNPGLAPNAAALNVGALGGVLTGFLPSPGLGVGVAAANIGALGGVLNGFLPNPNFAPGVAANNIGQLGGVLTGTLPNPGMAGGAAAGNVGTLGGALTGVLPDPQLAPGAAANNVGALSGDLSGTLPSPSLAPGAAVNNVGQLGGVLSGRLPNPSFSGPVLFSTNFIQPVTTYSQGLALSSYNASNPYSVQVTGTAPCDGYVYAFGGHNLSDVSQVDSNGTGLTGELWGNGSELSTDGTALTQWHEGAYYVPNGTAIQVTYYLIANQSVSDRSATIRVGYFFLPT